MTDSYNDLIAMTDEHFLVLFSAFLCKSSIFIYKRRPHKFETSISNYYLFFIFAIPYFLVNLDFVNYYDNSSYFQQITEYYINVETYEILSNLCVFFLIFSIFFTDAVLQTNFVKHVLKQCYGYKGIVGFEYYEGRIYQLKQDENINEKDILEKLNHQCHLVIKQEGYFEDLKVIPIVVTLFYFCANSIIAIILISIVKAVAS